MRKVVRWNPTAMRRSLINDFEDMVDSMMRLQPYEEQMSWNLALDVAENDESFIIKASVPGVDPDDIEITLEDNTLTIKGTISEEKEIEEGTYHLRERRSGQFLRSVTLPARVHSDDVSAGIENGVLTLTVPKAEEARARRIAIQRDGQSKVIEAQTE